MVVAAVVVVVVAAVRADVAVGGGIVAGEVVDVVVAGVVVGGVIVDDAAVVVVAVVADAGVLVELVAAGFAAVSDVVDDDACGADACGVNSRSVAPAGVLFISPACPDGFISRTCDSSVAICLSMKTRSTSRNQPNAIDQIGIDESWKGLPSSAAHLFTAGKVGKFKFVAVNTGVISSRGVDIYAHTA